MLKAFELNRTLRSRAKLFMVLPYKIICALQAPVNVSIKKGSLNKTIYAHHRAAAAHRQVYATLRQGAGSSPGNRRGTPRILFWASWIQGSLN